MAPQTAETRDGSLWVVGANDPVILSEPGAVWVVEDGNLALFLQTRPAQGDARRRFLFSVCSGEALFGGVPETEGPTLIAVALVESRLKRIAAEDAELRRVCGSDGAARRWLENLDHSLPAAAELPATALVPGQQLRLGDGSVLRPSNTAWLALARGGVCWAGRREAAFRCCSPMVAISRNLWASIEGESEVVVCDADSAWQQPSHAVAAIAQYQAAVAYMLDEAEQRNEQERADAVIRRSRAYRQSMEEVVRSFGEAARGNRAPLFSIGHDALTDAISVICQALDVRLRRRSVSPTAAGTGDPVRVAWELARMRIRKVRLGKDWWKMDVGPLLAFRGQANEPVVLLPGKSGQYELVDAAAGSAVAVDDAVGATISNHAYSAYRPLPEEALGPWTLVRFGFRSQGRTLLLLACSAVIATLLGMTIPLATASLMDTVIPDANRRLLLQLGLALLGAAIGRFLFELVEGFAAVRLETAAGAHTQTAVWDRLLALSPTFFRRYSAGDLAMRTMAVSGVREKLGVMTLRTLFVSFVSGLNLLLMYWYSPPLALVATLAAVVMVCALIGAGVLCFGKSRRLQELEGKLAGLAVQLIHGVSKLRVAAAEEAAFAYGGRQFSEQQILDRQVRNVRDWMHVFNKIVPTLTSVIIFALAAVSVREQSPAGLSLGAFLAFYIALGTFLAGASDFSNTLIDTLDVLNLWQRCAPILKATPEDGSSKTDPGVINGDILVRHVSFRYAEAGPLTLDDVSLHARPGEFVAIVGPSGSGKSTLLRLLLGFETPSTGTIYYDGQDLAGLDLQALRRQFGVAIQNGRILSASIFDNIAAGAQISLDEAWRAAVQAQIADDIASMPMGMFTYVSEGGSTLSGGQVQRIFLARALARKPRLLLLDEATSALDNASQSGVSASLEQLQITRIAIAHRLSTIERADRIYVLDRGRIVQSGTFAELARAEGPFAKFVARQTF